MSVLTAGKIFLREDTSDSHVDCFGSDDIIQSDDNDESIVNDVLGPPVDEHLKLHQPQPQMIK